MRGITRRNLLQLSSATLAAASFAPAIARAAPARVISIDARPRSTDIDLSRTAVIVVDMQNDFGAKGGMFDRAGIDISGIQKVVAPTARVLELARQANVRIVYLKMAYRVDLTDLGPTGSFNRWMHEQIGVGTAVTAPDGRASRILVRNTWNTEILPDLKPRNEDTVIYKTRFSGFYATDLDERLRSFDIRHLLFTGCTTSVCVESTVRDAAFRDYTCILFSDCMYEPLGHELPRTNHDATLDAIAGRFGWVTESSALAKALHT
jgi:ureidoacrylate peracid hydrolase